MPLTIPLEQIRPENATIVGGKAAVLARIGQEGIAVPGGLSISIEAYRRYLAETGLGLRIARELNRKPFKDMRWEELWDAALRIRNMFLKSDLPDDLYADLFSAVDQCFADRPVAVRSSAPGEDSERTSFAGLHESFVNVRGARAVLDHVRLVWASLWSDRALLYRQELDLEVASSSMAVLVQELAPSERSGVAFSESPLDPTESVIEAVYGLNQGLVDGTVQPDRWTLERKTGRVLAHQPAERFHALLPSSEGVEKRALSPEQRAQAPLGEGELEQVHRLARTLEESFGRPQDVEWTFCDGALYALQSRPITTRGEADDQRQWYLTLTRSLENLCELRQRVEDELIPEMQRVAVELGRSELTELSDLELAGEIARREEIYQHWVDVYWTDFIPLAHGVRLFGQVYNDTVRPEDPYEFMGLLAATPMQSLQRNAMLEQLAAMIRGDANRAARLRRGEPLEEDTEFVEALDAFLTEFGDLAWQHGQPSGERQRLLPLLLELAERGSGKAQGRSEAVRDLTERFLNSFSEDRRGFAEGMLDLARASYQLRDDDNIHLARVEAQLLAAQAEARRPSRERAEHRSSSDRGIGARCASGEAGPRHRCSQRPIRRRRQLDHSSPAASRSARGPWCGHRSGAGGGRAVGPLRVQAR